MAVDSIARGIAGSKADLINGKVPIDQIPGAAFDYVEGYYFEGAFYSDEEHTKVITPSTQKIYLDKPTDNIYRWTGSQYVLTSGVYVASATAPDNKELIWIDISDNNGLINKDDLSDSVFSNLALPYNPTSGTYDVGDWCINNKTLYECTTEIPVSEAWNPAHWTQHPVTDAMYVKPTSGVPYSDLSNSVQDSLDLADSAYQKPNTGIPISDLNESIQNFIFKPIPPTFKRVWYIQFTGTQYIDTGVVPTANTGMSINVTYDAVGTNPTFFGSRESNNTTTFGIIISGKSPYYMYYGLNGWKTFGVGATIGTLYSASYNYLNNGMARLNNISKQFTAGRTVPNQPIHIGAMCVNETIISSSYLYGKIYGCIVTESDTIIRNYIPVVRESDNVAGLYDTITNTFLTNSGTGNFVVSREAGAYLDTKGVAFGTSLTYRGSTTEGYTKYLPSLLGATIDNQGVGSSYWLSDAQTSSNVLYNIQNYNNYSDKDFVLIEGCVNDWYHEKALGTYKDVGTVTVCGCLYNMISHIYAQKPSIQIIVVLDHYGRNYNSVDCSQHSVKNGLTQFEYYSELEKLCEFNGIPCIPLFKFSSLSTFGVEYLTDNIHPTALGAQQVAECIYNKMFELGIKKK